MRAVAVATVMAGLSFLPAPALAIDWSQVEGNEVKLFHPGQASWEWVLTKSDHSGATKFREGKNCRECHGGEESDIGALINSGKKVEPHPLDGRRGHIAADVKMAHDGENFYVRVEYPADGGTAQGMDADYAQKVTVMFDDGSVAEAGRAGCWGVCHDDANGMASAKDGVDMPKYLMGSRTKITRQGGGEFVKPEADIAKMMAGGQYLEYWQARLNPGQPAAAVDGHILDRRETNDSTVASAEGGLEGDKWVVVLSRPLNPGGGAYKPLEPGKTYTAGFAIHDNNTAGRYHHVSFEYTFALDGGDAVFVAKKQ